MLQSLIIFKGGNHLADLAGEKKGNTSMAKDQRGSIIANCL